MNRVCKICNTRFASTFNYKRHYKSKHVGEQFGKNYVIVGQQFKCHNCEKCFNRKDTLQRHIISLHADLYSSEDCFTCHDCKKSFRAKQYLKRHIKSHMNAGTETSKVCEICNKNFTRVSNYKRHYRSKHIRELLGKNIIVDKIFECHSCGKRFNRKDTLQRHISLHTNLYSSEDCFTCHNCKKSYRFERYLKRHIKKKHINAETETVKKCKCPLCYEAFANEAIILDHFKVIHSIPIEKQHLQFNSKSEFDDWRKDVEISMNCSYIYHSHYEGRGTGKQTWKWQCHRNGNFTPVALRKRRPSKKGSKKLNTFCPSMIKLVIKPDNFNNLTCYVDFIPIHIGHSTDKKELIHVRFDSSIRDMVAEKLGAEIPISKILKDIRHTGNCYLSDELYYKEQLITKKDIRNIGYLRNISNINITNRRRCPNDDNQVEDYVFDPKNRDSILFFKNHDENHHVFKKEDFVLIIMKIKQMEKLIKYGSNIVCLDGSHCTNLYDYTLHTLLVVDEYEEGHPCCFMISNKNNDSAFQYMFSTIKKKIGVLQPICFMSDIQQIHINAWRTVMEYEPKYILWCTWHVKNAWKKHYCQIKSAEKREALEAQLNDLLHEPDVTKFHEKLSTFLCITDQHCRKFMDYFIGEYISKYQLWANAYRQHANINTNIRVERFRKSLNYKFMKGVKFGQLQDLLHTLDDIEDKSEDALIYDIKGKLTTKEHLMQRAHNEALKYEFVENLIYQKGEKEYIVKSLSGHFREYTILKTDCNVINCMDKCEECEVCIHQFKCSCPDNSIQSNMCKHIHLLCLQRLEELSSQFIFIDIKSEVQDENLDQKPDVHVKNHANVNIES